MHLNSKLIFQKNGIKFIKPGGLGLEIGPAGFPSVYMKLLEDKSIKWHTLDIDTKHIGNAAEQEGHIISKQLYTYPIKADNYDLIIAGQVIEHVADIWKWMEELKRILKPGGTIIIVCPVSWPYHEAPIDCWRIYPAGFEALAEKVGLRLLHSKYHSYEADLIHVATPTYGNISRFNLNEELNRTDKIKCSINSIFSKVPFLRKVKFPISVAYDSIAILSKEEK
jgi:SAM-dependent methyltransferase